MKATHITLVALGLWLTAACGEVAPPTGEQAAPPATPAAPAEPVDLAALLQEIRTAAGIARADDVAQCRAVALGAKPCGGPERYLVYSTLTADEARLQALVERYNAAATQLARDQDLVSDCQVIEPPELGLEGGFCMPVPRFEM